MQGLIVDAPESKTNPVLKKTGALLEAARLLGIDNNVDCTTTVAPLGKVIPVLSETKKKGKQRYVFVNSGDPVEPGFLWGSFRSLRKLLAKRNALLDTDTSPKKTADIRERVPDVVRSGNVKEMPDLMWTGHVTHENSWELTDFLNSAYDAVHGKVCIHLVDGCADGCVEPEKYALKFRIVVCEPMDPEERARYLSGADVCISTDYDSIIPSLMGVATAVRPSSESPYRNDRLVYTFDLDGNEPWVTHEFLKNRSLRTVHVAEVLDDAFDAARMEEYGNKCRQFAIQYLCGNIGLLDDIGRGPSRARLMLSPAVGFNYLMSSLYCRLTKGTYGDYCTFFRRRKQSGTEVNTVQSEVPSPESIQDSYPEKVERIRHRSGKLKVAFLVTFKETFPSSNIFLKMTEDPRFEPRIIVIPNVFVSVHRQNELFASTSDAMKKRYGESRVIDGYDVRSNEYLELGDEYQVIFFSNPYDIYDHPLHNIRHFASLDVLPVYVDYGFPALKFWDEVISLDFYNTVWKACVETQSNMDHLSETGRMHGRNALLTGYPKMDSLFGEKKKSVRKTVMIAPHHTVAEWSKLTISNFLRFSSLFLELPKMFPEVDFIFRPHQLLFGNLKSFRIWTDEEIEDYLRRIDETENMIYDTSDYYMDKFADCDAIIHDCGSFIAEWLYTRKPCCYMMRSVEMTMDTLLPIGQECMDCYYSALDENDIISFIRDVVIAGNDPKKDMRERFASEKLMVNYPHSAETVVSYLASELIE